MHLIPLYKKRWMWGNCEGVKGLTLQNTSGAFFKWLSLRFKVYSLLLAVLNVSVFKRLFTLW